MNNHTGVAIVGMACIYPDATGPQQLWENVLAQRRAFRRLPAQRLSIRDYVSTDPAALDSTYSDQAAVIADYEFDRTRFRISGNSFRSTDMVHWLALDVASRALLDAKFPEGAGLPRESTGVLVGNTLTGEFSRAQSMRLRWPYVKGVLSRQLERAHFTSTQRQEFLEAMEAAYKEPFAPMSEETLAGGLSNTIAGRICNQYDLGGGGHTVDGACCSSLLAVANACTALAAGDLDVAVVGGVDLSLDPFELVGFSRVGALARQEMRVFDEQATGFLPGEGCGFVVLMRERDAARQPREPYAVIRGWGISSDGKGGLTRPEVAGQMRALQRAYARAPYGIESVKLFEGHGTGTAVGDAVELNALVAARSQRGQTAGKAAVGSIKANIGHTKAAAGIAGLIKSAMAAHFQIRPPSTGVIHPHPILRDAASGLEVLEAAELWREVHPLRSGVSAFGFGGINVHVTLEGAQGEPRTALTPRERSLLSSPQDCELFVLSAGSLQLLQEKVDHLLQLAPDLSRAELVDVSAALAANLDEQEARAAVVAATPDELNQRLSLLRDWLREGRTDQIDLTHCTFLGAGRTRGAIVLMFPGQASPVRLQGGAWERRFASVADLYSSARLIETAQGVKDPASATEVAQPAIVTAELAGLEVLQQFGIVADRGIGHSLGEISAMVWAGALSAPHAIELARHRGKLMSMAIGPSGAMAALGASREVIHRLIAKEDDLCVAAINAPLQGVISGDRAAVARAVAAAKQAGIAASMLPVAHAFHSPHMRAAARSLGQALKTLPIYAPNKQVFSTVTGMPIGRRDQVDDILVRQLTMPVLFSDALESAADGAALCIEVGPGSVLAGLASAAGNVPALSLDVGGKSFRGLLSALGAVFALGGEVQPRALWEPRFVRNFDFEKTGRQFFRSPCALTWNDTTRIEAPAAAAAAELPIEYGLPTTPLVAATDSALDVLCAEVAARAEIPLEIISASTRLLADLHLNSITVAQIVAETSRRLGILAPHTPTDFADASVAQIVEALEGLRRIPGSGAAPKEITAGLDPWVRAFRTGWEVLPPLAAVAAGSGAGQWTVIAPQAGALQQQLHAALQSWGRTGVAVYLAADVEQSSVMATLLLAAKETLKTPEAERYFVLIQEGPSSAAFLRSLYLESRNLTVVILDAPSDELLIERVVAEVSVAQCFHAVSYRKNARFRELLELVAFDSPTTPSHLTAQDRLLVTGGGKGIAAECALALAQHSGVRLLLMGRSDPAEDEVLCSNLERFKTLSVSFEYLRVDVGDTATVASLLRQAVLRGGPVTAVLHAAGTNQPKLVSSLELVDLEQLWNTKVFALDHLLACLDSAALKWVFGFGSIIARTGLPGEAHYGLANQGLANLTEAWGREHPHCRCLTLEWSIWSDIGMGQRLGVVESLAREGISAITPDQGIGAFMSILNSDVDGSVIVSSRLPTLATLQFRQSPLPLLRFIESPRVHVEAVELITDATISSVTDPYLDNHVLSGERLFPAVLGLEAMAQCAQGLVRGTAGVRFSHVEFNRAISVREGEAAKIRVLGVARDRDTVDCAVRCESSGFALDHFRGVYRAAASAWPESLRLVGQHEPQVTPAELYKAVLFQRGRFRVVSRYHHLTPWACRFQTQSSADNRWFGAYLPSGMLLGDPAGRDGTLHGIQACVPNERLLPVAVESLTIDTDAARISTRMVTAVERSREGPMYTYDVDVRDLEGRLIESWRGLCLRSVGLIENRDWPVSLFSIYLERRLAEWMPEIDIRFALNLSDCTRRSASEGAAAELLGPGTRLIRRSDGMPQLLEDPRTISISHSGDLSLAVTAKQRVSCDLQAVDGRSAAQWSDLLGAEGMELARTICASRDEALSASATRVWACAECLKKSGAPFRSPLAIRSIAADGWLVLGSGERQIATCIPHFDAGVGDVAVAILTSEVHETI